MNRIFDTDVQALKHKVLTAVAKSAFNNSLTTDIYKIPKQIITGPKPQNRCCIYKERAIVEERIALAMGGDKTNPNIVEVIKIACDECPISGYSVSDRCRGCIAHNCQRACHKDAIKFDLNTRRAIIDKSKCVNCGMCARACQYNAIQNNTRPCEQSCNVHAISMGEDYSASIDYSKCIECGACVYSCPFGAIMDKSSITDVIKELINNKNNKLYAVIAPSIVSSYKKYSINKIATGIKKLGFNFVYEAALGADLVAKEEAKEIINKELLTSSCCPAFVSLIKKHYKELVNNISSSISPMAMIAKYIKGLDKDNKVIFIGPCIAKKGEIKLDKIKNYVDYVLTFEELEAMFEAKEIELSNLEDGNLDNGSYYGRLFARCGGVANAVIEALKEDKSNYEVKHMSADGVNNCKVMLNKIKYNSKDYNFLEGMACVNGCVNGPCSLSHSLIDKSIVDKYASESDKKDIISSVNKIKGVN